MADATVEILLLAQDAASGVFGKLGEKVGGLGIALGGLAVGAVAAFGNLLGDSVQQAMKAQNAETQLDAVLKSTSSAFGNAASQMIFHATSTGQVTQAVDTGGKSIKAYNAELAKAPANLEMATARLHDMEAAYSRSKHPTEAATLSLERQREKVQQLTDMIAKGAAGVTQTSGVKGYWENIPGPVQMSRDALIQLSQSLAESTRFDKESVLGGESLLLTFTKIGKDIFPQATQTVLDMSQALGQDVKSSAIELGKALQDPVLGMTALRRVGVNFSKDQIEVVKHLVATGQSAQAQAMIMKELQTEFGGSAKAAGTTFAGQMDILNHRIDDAKETIGTALIPILLQLMSTLGPVITTIFTAFGKWFASPEVQAGMKSLGDSLTAIIGPLGVFVSQILTGLSQGVDPIHVLLNAFDNLFTVLGINQGSVQNILSQIISSVINWASSMLPILGNALVGLGQALIGWISDALPGVLAELSILLQDLLGWVMSSLPSWLAALVQLGLALVQWVLDALPGLMANLLVFLSRMISWVMENLPTWITALANFATAAANWIIDAMPGMLTNLGLLGIELWNWITQEAPIIGGWLLEWVNKFLNWIRDSVLPGLPEELGKIAKQMGLWIGSEARALPGQIKAWVDAYSNWYKDVIKNLAIHLPEIGKQILDFLTELATDVAKAAENVGSNMVLGLLEGFGLDVSKITPDQKAAIGRVFANAVGLGQISIPIHDYPGMALAGQPYQIRTPELFIPPTTGSIIPLGGASQSMTLHATQPVVIQLGNTEIKRFMAELEYEASREVY